MGSKAFVLLGVFAIVLLIISSEVAARDLLTAHTTSTDNKNVAAEEAGTTIGVDDAKYGGNGGYQGDHPGRGGNGGRGGYGGGHGGGGGGYGGGRGGGGGGGRCYYGCCRQSYYRRGCERCCNHAGEAVDAQPHN